MTKIEFIKNASTKISNSKNKILTTQNIISEIDSLTYENTNLPISKETKVELLEGIIKIIFPHGRTISETNTLLENSNEEYIKILTKSIRENK